MILEKRSVITTHQPSLLRHLGYGPVKGIKRICFIVQRNIKLDMGLCIAHIALTAGGYSYECLWAMAYSPLCGVRSVKL
jgi:hypothetical protein